MSEVGQLCLILFAVTLATRLGPLLLGDLFAEKPFFKRIAGELPAMILIFLIIQDLEKRVEGGAPLLPAIVGIFAATAIHAYKRQLILSIIAGVAVFYLASSL